MSTHTVPQGQHGRSFNWIEGLLLVILILLVGVVAAMFAWGRRDGWLFAPVPTPTALAEAILPTVTEDVLRPASPTASPAEPATPTLMPATETAEPIAAATATATPIPPTPTTACVHAMRFVADVTIPDDSRIPPGVSFVKTWRIRNAGNCTWPAGTVGSLPVATR
jgi:hypothetical protein